MLASTKSTNQIRQPNRDKKQVAQLLHTGFVMLTDYAKHFNKIIAKFPSYPDDNQTNQLYGCTQHFLATFSSCDHEH